MYSQFVKRYENTKTVPPSYNFQKDLKLGLTQKDIDNEDYIFTDKNPVEKEKGRKLPRYIPIDGGKQWMRLRRPLALRLHKFKQKENAHEYYYSEMQLYLPFEKEDDLFPDDLELCRKKYEENLPFINNIKKMWKKNVCFPSKGGGG